MEKLLKMSISEKDAMSFAISKMICDMGKVLK